MICCLPRANMKKTFSVVVALVVSLICLSVAKAGDVSVKVRMTAGPQDPPSTTFASNTPTLYAIFKTEGANVGDKIRGVWVADDVGNAAAPHTKIEERTLTADGDTYDGEFTLSNPPAWPVGKYHFEIYVNNELATQVKFTIKAANVKKSQEESEEESRD